MLLSGMRKIKLGQDVTVCGKVTQALESLLFTSNRRASHRCNTLYQLKSNAHSPSTPDKKIPVRLIQDFSCILGHAQRIEGLFQDQVIHPGRH